MLRFLIFVGISTVLALLFVHNQIKIYLFSYQIEKNGILYEELLDKNRILLYDINRLSSLSRISQKLELSKAEFTIPKQIVKLEREIEKPLERKENFLVRLFKSRSLVEAREIKK